MKRKKNQDRLEMYVYQHDGEKDDAFGEIYYCGHIQTCLRITDERHERESGGTAGYCTSRLVGVGSQF